MSATWDSKDLEIPLGADEILFIDVSDGRNQKRGTLSSAGLGIWSTSGSSTFLTTIANNVGIGLSSSISAKLHILETTEQLRLSFDGTKHSSFVVDSEGNLTITPSGGNLNMVNLVLSGNLVVNGTTITKNAETINLADNHIFLNSGYKTASAESGGLVVNYLPTATVDVVTAGAFVAGVASTSNPTVVTVGAAVFATSDIIQISGSNISENDGVYEVLSHAANLLTIRGVGTTATIQDYSDTQFTANASDNAAITKINVSVLHAGTDGEWATAKGSNTPLSFSKLVTVNATQTLLNKSFDSLPSLIIIGDLKVDTDTFFVDSANNKVGVGIASSILGSFHIKNGGTASTVAAFSDELVLENSGDVGATIIAGDSSNAHIVFRNQSDNSSSIIRYRANGETLTIDVGTAGTLFSILGSGVLAYNGDAFTINSEKNSGFGTTAPLAKINALSTTEQLRLSYNVTNFAAFTVDSSGNLTIQPSGNSLNLQATQEVKFTTGGTERGSFNQDGDFEFLGLMINHKWKEPVRCCSVENVSFFNGVEVGDIIDGVTLVLNDRVLLRHQTAADENGLHVVRASGSPTRAKDGNSSDELLGMSVLVKEGTINRGLEFKIFNIATITVGVTALTFVDENDTPKLKNIHVAADLGTLETGTDGNQRVKVIEDVTYLFYQSMTIPRVEVPASSVT